MRSYGPKPRPILQRLIEKLDMTAGPDGCWPFMGCRRGGYGRIGGGQDYPGKTMNASRVAHEIFNGPIPEGYDVLHSCDNPPCCNPKHLFVGTAFDNIQDMQRKGRHRYAEGELSGHAVLTADKVREIRRRVAAGEQQNRIAVEFGVTPFCIHAVWSRKSWRHIP